jgi:hypothetical protein
MENKGYYKKKGGEAHMGREWDSDESSTDSSSDEDAVNKGLLFPNVDHKCLMAKESKKKKIHSRDTPKYTTSDDEGSSSDDNEKFKFARSMLYNGRHPDIKDGIGFQQESQSNIKHNAPRTDSLILLRVRLPWFMIERVIFYILKTILSTKLGKLMLENLILFCHHAYMYSNEASSSRHSTHIKMPKKKIVNASNEHNISFKTFDASFVLTNKSGKVVAKYVGGKHKSPKTCVWVPKVLVSNVKGPKTVWVPKNKA